MATKLSPPRACQAALRPDLTEAVAQTAHARLLLVRAPAGYGKTTVLAAVARRLDWRVAWYRLDHLDRDPAGLVISLAEAVRRVVPRFAESLLTRVSAGEGGEATLHELLGAFVTALVEETADDLFLVLDDFHEAGESRDVSSTVGYLLANLPANVHVVVLTRHEPSFAITKLRLAGDLCEIGRSRLSFSRAQVQQIVRSEGRQPLEPAQIDLLLDQVEGWPAGVVLALDRLPSDEGLGDMLADVRLKQDLHSYFVEQVFSDEDAATRRFLKDTCCLESMTVDLVERIAGVDAATWHLARLRRRGVFTFTDAATGRLRYHRLFREFLCDQSVQEDGIGFFRDLRVRTAGALRAAGCFAAATELYLAAQFPAAALSTLEQGGEATIEDCPAGSLKSWPGRLPACLPRRDAWTNMLEGQALARDGRHDQAAARYSRAEESFKGADDRAGELQALSLTEAALRQKGDEGAAAACRRRALVRAADDEQRLHALVGLASHALRTCDWHTADRVWRRAAASAALAAKDAARIACQQVQALACRGEFGQAVTQGRSLLRRLTPLDMPSVALPLLDMLAFVEIQTAAYEHARGHLDRCFEECDRYGYPHLRRLAEGTLGLLSVTGGRLEHGIDLMSAVARDEALVDNVICRAGNLTHIAVAWRHEGDLARAERTCDEALALAGLTAFPSVYLDCLAEREFLRLTRIGDAADKRLRALAVAARRYGLSYVALKCAFFCSLLGAGHAGGDPADGGLVAAVSRQLELGHACFVGHELALVPDTTTAVLGRCSRSTAAGLLDALCRIWEPLPLAIRALTVSEAVAMQTLKAAAAGFCEDDLYRLARRARRSGYPAVRRLAAELMAVRDGELGPPAASIPELTPREAEVLGLIASGLSNAELAAQLCLSPATIKTHINHIFSKLGVRDRVQAIIAYRSRMKL